MKQESLLRDERRSGVYHDSDLRIKVSNIFIRSKPDIPVFQEYEEPVYSYSTYPGRR